MKSMGQRAGSCFDLGINIAFAETHASRVDGPNSGYIPDVRRDLGVAGIHAGNILSRDKILINKGHLDGLADPGHSAIQGIRQEWSEQINIFDSSRGTFCG